MTRHRVTPRIRIVAAVVGVLVLGACGAGSTRSSGSGNGATGTPATKDAGRLVAASADATHAAKSARMSMTMTMSAAGRSGSFTADGAFDFAGRKGVMTMDVSSLGLPGAQGKVEMRIVDGVIYLDMGGMLGDVSPADRQALGGKRWMKLDLAELGATDTTGGGGFGLGGLGSSDPTSVLDSLRGAGADVHEVGHDTVRGVETTHYRAQIDLGQALSRIPDSERARAGKALQALGNGAVPADVWIDGQGRLRKFVMDLGATAGPTTVGTLTMELYDFGTEVDVQAPPASETFDLQSMFQDRLDQNRGVTDLRNLQSS